MIQVHSKVIQLYKYIYIIFEIIFHHRLLQDIEYSALCCAAGPIYMPATKLPDTSSMALSGEDIPLAARIVALADVYDALRHKRCYKDEWSIEDTFNVIKEERGKQFDPELVDAFFQVKDRLEAINKALS